MDEVKGTPLIKVNYYHKLADRFKSNKNIHEAVHEKEFINTEVKVFELPSIKARDMSPKLNRAMKND